jgi:hypothetical protein
MPRIIFARDKSAYARQGRDPSSDVGNVLIDDKDSHVAEWQAAGGTAFCVRRPWNHGETSLAEIVSRLLA